MSLNNPYTQPPPEPPDETDPTFPETGNPQRFLGMGCNWNGMPVDCPYLMDQISKRAESLPTYRVDVGAVWRTVMLETVTTMDGPDSDGVIRIGSTVTHPYGYWQMGSRVSFAGFTQGAGAGQPSPQGGGQQGSGSGSGGAGASTSWPHPCDGVKASDLDFNAPRRPSKNDPTTTGIDHIFFRHVDNPGNGASHFLWNPGRGMTQDDREASIKTLVLLG
jgi:hypothetical protein